MNRTEKAEGVRYLTEQFKKAQAAFLVDFKGMTVEEVTRLRKNLKVVKADMKVVRNTLAKRALADMPKKLEIFAEKLVGSNAFIFAFEDASASAKTVTEFGKKVDALQIKFGVMGDDALSEESIKQLASLPSKDVLRAQLLGVLAAPASKFVRTLAAVPTGFVRVLDQKQLKQIN